MRLLSYIVRRLFFSSVRRTMFVLLIIVLVPGMAIEISHYRAMSEEYRNHELTSAVDIAHAVASSFDSYIHRLLYAELALGAALASPLPIEQANRLLATGAAEDPAIRVYSWINPLGKVIASSDPRSVGQDFSVRPYFRQIVEGRDWVVSDLLEGQSGERIGFTVARGVRDDAGVLQGVLGAMVDASQLGSVIRMERAGRASVGLIDRQGRLAYRAPGLELAWDQRNILASQPFIRPALEGEVVTGTFTTFPDQQRRIASYVPLGLTGWVAGAGRPEDEVMGPVAGELFRESAFRLLSTLAVVAIAMAVGRIITVPIRRVRENAIALGRGERGVPLDVAGPNELKDLADTFNRMAGEIQSREETLRRYQLLNRIARDIILFIRTDGRIIEANEAAVGAYGYDQAELRSMRIGDLSAPGASYLMDARSQDADQDSILFETVHRRKDGSTFPVEIASQGAMVGDERLLLAIIRDATKRKQAEQELTLRSGLLDAATDSVFLHDFDLRILYANQAAWTSHGYTREELLVRGISGIITPEHAVWNRARLEELQKTGRMFFQSEHIRKDGSLVPVEVHNRIIEMGERKLVLSVVRDITDRKRAEEARIVQFQHLDAMFDSINAIVYVADINTHELIHMNRYAEELFGHDNLGRCCYEVLQVGQTQQCPFCTNSQLVVDGVPQPPYVWEFQNTVTGKWFMCIDRAIAWDDGRLVRMEVAVDITQRKQADQFRDQYVFTVSHDLRNPLGAIQGMAQLLLRKLERGDRTDSEVRTAQGILTSAERMNSIIQDLLDSVRLETGQVKMEKQTLNLASCVGDLLERSAQLIGDRQVRTEIPASLLVSADPSRMERVLMNLLTNAIKYSLPATEVLITASNGNGEAVVAITDQGSGISPEDLPHVFERFYRSKAARGVEGIGLGLYITRMLVEAHGGRVWAESEPGHGSAFHFTIPLA